MESRLPNYLFARSAKTQTQLLQALYSNVPMICTRLFSNNSVVLDPGRSLVNVPPIPRRTDQLVPQKRRKKFEEGPRVRGNQRLLRTHHSPSTNLALLAHPSRSRLLPTSGMSIPLAHRRDMVLIRRRPRPLRHHCKSQHVQLEPGPHSEIPSSLRLARGI